MTARLWTRMLADSACSYVRRHGRPPVALLDLVAPLSGPRELKELVPDPWGTPYRVVFLPSPRRFVATSAGPDRTFGNDDDIASELLCG